MYIEHKYKVFISYSHQDKPFARWLQKGIENHVISRKLRDKYPQLPLDLKRSVFRDDDELASASILTDSLKDALENSECLVVVCSKHAVNSKWVNEEIAYFKNINGVDKIFTIIASGDAHDVLPPILGSEPLAVDAQKGKKVALMKIIASVLNIDFSDLWEREKRETKKRFFFKGIWVVLFLAIASYSFMQYMAISSNSQLNDIHTTMSSIEYKLKNKKLSTDEVYALQKSLQRLHEIKKTKEDTLKWFGMLQTTLAKKAKLVYDKNGVHDALAILESEKSRSEDVAYAKKNILRAKLYIEIHDYTKANYFYEKAIAVDDSYTNVYEYVLFLMKENQTEQAQQLLEKLYQYDLKLEEKANVFNRIGINYRKLKHLDKAEKSYLKALDLRKKLTENNPSKYAVDLAWTYNNLGVLYKKTKELNASEVVHLKAYTLRKNLAVKNPKKYTFYVTCSMHNLGELYSSMDKDNKAERLFMQAIKIRRTLVFQNPKQYMPALASSLHELAALYRDTSRYEASLKLYTEALAFRRTLAKNNPQAYGANLLDTLKGLETLYIKMGHVKEAKSLKKEIRDAT